jgi:hypothetical protein
MKRVSDQPRLPRKAAIRRSHTTRSPNAPRKTGYHRGMTNQVIDMGTSLDPFVHVHETPEEAAEYDRWLNAKLAHAVANRGGPLTDGDAVFEEMERLIDSDEGDQD